MHREMHSDMHSEMHGEMHKEMFTKFFTNYVMVLTSIKFFKRDYAVRDAKAKAGAYIFTFEL